MSWSEDQRANVIASCRYMILERNKKNHESPSSGTAVKPDRRKRPASMSSRSSNTGGKEDQQSPRIGQEMDQWTSNSMEPMDTLFEENHFNEAMCASNTFDEMLANQPEHWLGDWPNSKPVDLSQQYPSMMSHNDWQSSFHNLNQPTLHTTTEAGHMGPSISSKSALNGPGCHSGYPHLPDAASSDRMDFAFSGSESSSVAQSRLSSVTRTPTNSSSTSYETSSYVNPVDLGGEQWASTTSSQADGQTIKSGPQANSLSGRERQGSWSSAPSMERMNSCVSVDGFTIGDEVSRETKMVIENMQPELVERVLSLVLTSKSAIDVKIFGQDRSSDPARSCE